MTIAKKYLNMTRSASKSQTRITMAIPFLAKPVFYFVLVILISCISINALLRTPTDVLVTKAIKP
ncbi:hypothetical protein Plhal710r2_c040g0140041 [Plasmopara halstedii]